MKKVILVLVLLALLLCGCADGAGEKLPGKVLETTPTAAETVPSVQPVPETLPENSDEEAPAPGQHQAACSILEIDDSIRNSAGDVLVKITYDQVILDTSVVQWQGINDRIREDYLACREELEWLRETPAESWEEQIAGMGYVYGSLQCVYKAEVTQNASGLFSIRMTRDWFMGGVYNCDHYGMTFDLSTGEEVQLSQLSALPEEEFATQLKQIVCDALARDWDVLFEDPAQVLAEYTLEDFLFYMEEGELVLTFPTYTFGPGAMGALTVKTGLYPQR